MTNLLIVVQFHDGRFHGSGEWPPSPARLFQALVAGAGLSGPNECEKFADSLTWLERCDWPLVAAPKAAIGRSIKHYVPNNDLDAMGGDVQRIGSIRTSKDVRPYLFDRMTPCMYVWNFQEGEANIGHAQTIIALSERIYQFGQGVDMAWAWGELLSDGDLSVQLTNYPGIVSRPSPGSGRLLACPERGSLRSLTVRYRANSHRFTIEGKGRNARQLFSQAPKPRFAQISYDSPPDRRLYEIRQSVDGTGFVSWPLTRTSQLVERLRDSAIERLKKALPSREVDIEAVLLGRKAEAAPDGPTAPRIRIIPLPSIGHEHVDHSIRRVLIEVPSGCPMRANDIYWAFSGLDVVDEVVDGVTGEVTGGAVLIPAGDDGMLSHYGLGEQQARVWQSVTAAALPTDTARRRIEPARRIDEAKNGQERLAENARAASAVVQALRHADVRTGVDAIRVQREPFEARGARVESFATETRFAKERLWHIAITFKAPVSGPLVIGDGRFLGLGLMAPPRRVQGVHAFLIEGGLSTDDPPAMAVTRALQRAVIARAQCVFGARTRLPNFFTGHEYDGTASRRQHQHLTFIFDGDQRRLLVIAPHVLEQRNPQEWERAYLGMLDEALGDFRELRAGVAGRLLLQPQVIDLANDSLFAASHVWESVTPYHVTRHAKQGGAPEAMTTDLRAECIRYGLPAPRIEVEKTRGESGVGLIGTGRLTFDVAVRGPIVLGKTRHFGGGLFAACRR